MNPRAKVKKVAWGAAQRRRKEARLRNQEMRRGEMIKESHSTRADGIVEEMLGHKPDFSSDELARYLVGVENLKSYEESVEAMKEILKNYKKGDLEEDVKDLHRALLICVNSLKVAPKVEGGSQEGSGVEVSLVRLDFSVNGGLHNGSFKTSVLDLSESEFSSVGVGGEMDHSSRNITKLLKRVRSLRSSKISPKECLFHDAQKYEHGVCFSVDEGCSDTQKTTNNSFIASVPLEGHTHWG